MTTKYKAYFVHDNTRLIETGQKREGLESFLNSLPPEEELVLVEVEGVTNSLVNYTVVTTVDEEEV
jgi:hypothetical protein